MTAPRVSWRCGGTARARWRRTKPPPWFSACPRPPSTTAGRNASRRWRTSPPPPCFPWACEMACVTLGIGDLAAAKGSGTFIQTLALGSCIALILHDFGSRSAGMAHVALPDSAISPAKALDLPGYFADTAVPALLRLLLERAGRGTLLKPVVKLVGGANIADSRNTFNIGSRNHEAVRRALEAQGLGVFQSDVGKNYS